MIIRSIFHSVFTKLLLIGLATWLLILLSVLAVFVISKHDREGMLHRNAHLYLRYILDDIGTPPSRVRAVEIHSQTGLDISYQGPTDRWTTKVVFPEVDKIAFRTYDEDNRVQFGKRFGHHYLQVHTADGTFILELSDTDRDEQQHQWTHLLLIGLLSLVLIASYLMIRRVLAPLKMLHSGVEDIMSGNLGRQLPVTGRGELAELTRNFNQMSSKVKAMLEARERLLRDISHELRSPLSRIRVATELLADGDLRKDIEDDIREMDRLIAAILNAARENHQSRISRPHPTNLGQLLDEIAAKYEKVRPGVLHLSQGGEVICNADGDALKTVITNCLDNALKFSQEKGRPVEVSVCVDRDQAVITIADFGCGMDEGELGLIFDPFYRADNSRSRQTGGFGLGLSICKAIVEAHGGTISASSAIGIGTTMTIRLPLLS